MTIIIPTSSTPTEHQESFGIETRSTIYLPLIFGKKDPCYLGPQANMFFDFIKNGEQHRPTMQCSEALMKGAQQKAEEMANLDYFDHVSPSGVWPNALALVSGCAHPYQENSNNIESIGAGTPSAKAMYDALFNSPGHHPHIVGEGFFSSQIDYGIGYAFNQNSRYKSYWVFWTSVCEKGD